MSELKIPGNMQHRIMKLDFKETEIAAGNQKRM
jgi:hypothetical protein